jgi:hypothetical protein
VKTVAGPNVMPLRELRDSKVSKEGETSPSLEEIADRIFILESSGGKYVNCPLNTYNGFGWKQNKSEWKCYNTQEEVRGYVIKWLEEKTKKFSLFESLCLYNQGIVTSECNYVDKFNLL